MLSDSGRTSEEDKKFNSDVSNERFENKLFIRLVSLKIKFTKVNFKYSIFDSCYLRNCTFDSCDFTGCRFIGTNLRGTKFSNCEFKYATFDKTFIDNSILEQECPEEENLKRDFARSLRINYQSIGDTESANKAIMIELRADEEHFYKAWNYKSSYYINKYKGLTRFNVFIQWFWFKFQDVIWGNGESFIKLLITTFIIFIVIGLMDILFFKNNQYANAFFNAPNIFMGTPPLLNYPSWYLTVISIIRLTIFSLLMSIIIKRFSRR